MTITETRNSIEIIPVSGSYSSTGLIFYPGGLVDNHVYNEVLARFSENAGIKIVIVKMPANLAVFDWDAGIREIKNHSDIDQWIIAGHSLGGSMAATSVKGNSSTYKGLIFMDSYPPDSSSLKNWPGTVLSLFSSIEKTSDTDRLQQTLSLIPPATWLNDQNDLYPTEKTNYSVLHVIEGGSHSYFGTYGPQDGDYTPTISRDDFHTEVINYMTEFFDENGWR